MGNNERSRRQFLRASGLLGVLGLAGCTGMLDETTATPPDVGTVSEVPRLGTPETPTPEQSPPSVDRVTTFDAHEIPDYWEVMGGPTDAAEVTGDRSRAGDYALRCQLGSKDKLVLGITTEPEAVSLKDGDSFFAWLYIPRGGIEAEFGLTTTYETDDGRSFLPVPSLNHSSSGETAYTQLANSNGDMTETTLRTESEDSAWHRFSMTVYPSSNEVRYSVTDEFGNRQQSDRVAVGGPLAGEYHIHASGDHTFDRDMYIDKITAGPYRTGQVPAVGGNQKAERDQGKLTAQAPQITLNWAYYYRNLIPGKEDVVTADDAPDTAREYNVVSIISYDGPTAYYEEYQTDYGAKQRLSLSEGDSFSFGNGVTFNGSASVLTAEDIDGYPNDWYLLEDDSNIYALSRGGPLIAGGFVPKGQYLDPQDTLLRQIRTQSPAEGKGIAMHPLKTLPVFETQYGINSLDLETNSAASVPMEDFSGERAKELVDEWYDISLDLVRAREKEHEGVPIDAYEAYKVIGDGVDSGENFTVHVTSWISAEYATDHATNHLHSTDWTFDNDFPSDQDEESNLGPYDEDTTLNYPNCGLITENGVQKLRKHVPDIQGYRTARRNTYDVYSGNITMVRS